MVARPQRVLALLHTLGTRPGQGRRRAGVSEGASARRVAVGAVRADASALHPPERIAVLIADCSVFALQRWRVKVC